MFANKLLFGALVLGTGYVLGRIRGEENFPEFLRSRSNNVEFSAYHTDG